jgi:hypothetical protein
MPKLHEIVDKINLNITTGVFKSKRFQKGKVYGIAELVRTDENELKPCLVENSGEATYISIDDNYPFIIYHRVIGISANVETEVDFGIKKRIEETANMQLVCYADRSKIQFTKEDLIGGVEAAMAYEVPKADLSALNLNFCNIIQNSFNNDKQAVYDAEFNLNDFMLKPNHILFSLSYDIITNYDKNCLVLCD